jgi:DNA modification methylase
MKRWAGEGIKVQTCVTSPPYFGLRDYGHDGQIGLEETVDEYVAAIVDVFKHVKDLLADNGTLWLNLGDSYYNYRPGKGQSLVKQTVSNTNQDLPQNCARRGNKQIGLKEKDAMFQTETQIIHTTFFDEGMPAGNFLQVTDSM